MGRPKKEPSERRIRASVTWDPEVLERAQAFAEDEETTVSMLSEDALRMALDSKAFLKLEREKIRVAQRLADELELARETLAKVR